MVKWIGSIKLKTQLLTLIFIAIGIIILLQIIYLSWFGLINKKNYSQYLNDTLKQLEVRSHLFAKDIDNIANIISYNDVTYRFTQSRDIDEQLRLSNTLEVMIESITRSNKSIDDIIISNLDLINIGPNHREGFWVLNEIKRRQQAGEISFGSPSHYVLDGHPAGKPLYASVTKSYSSGGEYGDYVTVIIYNTESIADAVSSIQPNDNSLFMILDASGNRVAANRNDGEEEDLKNILHTSGPAIGKQSMAYHTTVQPMGWRIIGYTPDVKINKDLAALKQFGFLMGGIVIAVLMMFGYVINKSLTRPITKIARFMNSIGQNYSTQRLVIPNANEISLLAKALNKMLDNIDAMNNQMAASQEKLYKAEITQKQAQFLAFQSQINPHFLYNTLDCVRSIALARSVPEIFEIANAMAKIFRYNIKGNNYVMVSDELACIKDYFKIIQIRQGNRFSIVYNVAPVIMECTIPKMILQPIVENAVFHGLEQKKGEGTLVLDGRVDGSGRICFEIKDDGKGMSAEVLEKLQYSIANWDQEDSRPALEEKKSLGLLNIDRRIKLLYGREFGLSVSSGAQEGTSVFIYLPMDPINQKLSN